MARILIVDDEESIRFTFERFLRREGHVVHTADGFDEGLLASGEHFFDLVFVDILLGGKSGIDLLRVIKEKDPTIPVVMITGYPNVATASEAVRLGAFDYLAKPVVKDDLLRVTRLALQHKEAVDEKERCHSNIFAIFKSVKDAIIMVDKDLTVVEMNDAAEFLCGLDRASIGKPFTARSISCDLKCLDLLEETLRKTRTLEMHRRECRHNCGERLVANLVSTPVTDRTGAFIGAVLVVKDETRLASLEERLGQRAQFHRIVGKSDVMQRVYGLIERLADVATTVLITGETGTGKELVAEALHCTGMREGKPFIKVNCSALSESLLESELFGHVKGAFTGAHRDKAGRFQLAHGGTLFLDEIGDISHAIQQRLLRVLQEGEFERVGESKPTRVDVRVITATNKDLKGKVRRGEFREDLYYRLNVLEVHLPPLRERREDIPMLITHFIEKFNARLGKNIEGLSREAESLFMNHSWPGNVRELEHAIEHAFILCRQNLITLDHLPPELFSESSLNSPTVRAAGHREDEQILDALVKTAWNKAKAARLLGMSRRTIYRKIDEHGLREHAAGHV